MIKLFKFTLLILILSVSSNAVADYPYTNVNCNQLGCFSAGTETINIYKITSYSYNSSYGSENSARGKLEVVIHAH